MHMIRHHNPRKQPIPLRVKIKNRVLNPRCDSRMAQHARSMPRVQPRLKPLAPLAIALSQRRGFQFRFEPFEDRSGQAIRQMICDVLHHLRAFKMRQVPAAMPHPRSHPGTASLRTGGLAFAVWCAVELCTGGFGVVVSGVITPRTGGLAFAVGRVVTPCTGAFAGSATLRTSAFPGSASLRTGAVKKWSELISYPARVWLISDGF